MTELILDAEVVDEDEAPQPMDLTAFIPPNIDKYTAVYLFAAKLQHDCPLLTDDFFTGPNVDAKGYALEVVIDVEGYNGGMDRFRELVKYFTPMKKQLDEHSGMYVSRVYEFAGHEITLRITPPSGTCNRKETGKTEVKKVKKTVTPAVTEEVDEEVPVYEWECPSIFADMEEATDGEG